MMMAEMLNELKVLNEVADILRDLNKGEQRRTLEWLLDYFDVYDEGLLENAYVLTEEDDVVDFSDEDYEPEAEEAPVDSDFETLFAKVAPKTAIQKIVTAAWWLETKEGKDSWKSFEVNKLLKSIDIKVSSVSGTLAIEGKKEDSKIVVLEKSGDSMQARKTFRLSDAGFKFVEDRMA